MARYIDAEKLWNDRPLFPVGKDANYLAGFSECMFEFSKRIRKQLDTSTADVVPVVRCKDCEHGQFMPSCSMYLCRCTGGKLRYADNYCNYGERKEQE